jgi:hypothetical protein
MSTDKALWRAGLLNRMCSVGASVQTSTRSVVDEKGVLGKRRDFYKKLNTDIQHFIRLFIGLGGSRQKRQNSM